jgi:uncharacterized protein (DUF302 family)
MPSLIGARSPYDVPTTVTRIKTGLDRRRITLFAEIDHAAAAHSVRLELGDEVVLIFGNPGVGTALMQADVRTGLDLPLRLLIWDDGGVTRLLFHDPRELGANHVLVGQEAVFDGLRRVLDKLVQEAVSGGHGVAHNAAGGDHPV